MPWWQHHSPSPLLIVQVQQHVCAVVRTAPVLIADVMQTSAHAAQVAHVRVHQDVNRLVATRAAVKLPLNQVAAKKVNALPIKNKFDYRFYVRGRASKTGAAPLLF